MSVSNANQNETIKGETGCFIPNRCAVPVMRDEDRAGDLAFQNAFKFADYHPLTSLVFASEFADNPRAN